MCVITVVGFGLLCQEDSDLIAAIFGVYKLVSIPRLLDAPFKQPSLGTLIGMLQTLD